MIARASAAQADICVEHSLCRPVSITLAAVSGAPWRFFRVPDEMLSLGDDELLEWFF